MIHAKRRLLHAIGEDSVGFVGGSRESGEVSDVKCCPIVDFWRLYDYICVE